MIIVYFHTIWIYSIEIVWIYYGFSGAIANVIVWISHFYGLYSSWIFRSCSWLGLNECIKFTLRLQIKSFSISSIASEMPQILIFHPTSTCYHALRINFIYYMDNGVLLETKTLVELIRHYIRDQVRVFSVFHPYE
jgi:hypothetical protein